MDATSRRHFRAALKQAEADLAAHERSGEALRSTVSALQQLLGVGTAAPKPKPKPKQKQKQAKPRKRPGPKRSGAGHPDVPANSYRGMGPSVAYRKFVADYGDGYTAPQVRDALIQGGVKSASESSLLTGIHAVRRRDLAKAKQAAKAAKKAAAG